MNLYSVLINDIVKSTNPISSIATYMACKCLWSLNAYNKAAPKFSLICPSWHFCRNINCSYHLQCTRCLTSWKKEVRMELNTSVEARHFPKILRAIYSSPHAADIRQKVKSQNKVVKALIVTNNIISHSVFNFTNTIWTS